MAEGAVIKLYDQDGIGLLDTIPADYEDPINLETFESQIRLHRETPPVNTKSFIIARVTTLNYKGTSSQDRVASKHYSYYSAGCLNEIMYSVDTYARQVPKMRRANIMNPLTNTEIVGNVLYFIVMPNAGFEKLFLKKHPPADRPDVVVVLDPAKPDPETPLEQSTSKEPPSETESRHSAAVAPPPERTVYEAVAFATDATFLESGAIKKLFWANNLFSSKTFDPSNYNDYESYSLYASNRNLGDAPQLSRQQHPDSINDFFSRAASPVIFEITYYDCTCAIIYMLVTCIVLIIFIRVLY